MNNSINMEKQKEKLLDKRLKIMMAYRRKGLSMKRFHSIYDKLLYPTILCNGKKYNDKV